MKKTTDIQLLESLNKPPWISKYHRFYWYPSRLFRLDPKETPDCWRCEGELATLTHALWSHPKIQTFWKRVHENIMKVIRVDFEFCPSLYRLGNPKPTAHIVKPLVN